MTSSGNNPFVFPGLAPGADGQQNPIAASFEMMRSAWQNLSGVGLGGPADLSQPLTVEELDRRIAQLKTIENWLQLNLSMLSNTTQALQVQRATIATLKSFMGMPGTSPAADAPSPLEVAFGIKPSGQAKIQPAEAEASQAAEDADAPFPGADAAQGWWNMLQQQFSTLASATASTLQASQQAQQQAMAAAADAVVPVAEAAVRAAAPVAAKKSAAKKAAARKTAAKKVTAKKAAVKKSVAARKTAAGRKAG